MWRSRTGPTGRTPAPLPGRQGAPAQLVVLDRHEVRSSADEEVEVATDQVHARLGDRIERQLDAVVGQGTDLLGHCIRDLSQPRGFVRRHHTWWQATVGAGGMHSGGGRLGAWGPTDPDPLARGRNLAGALENGGRTSPARVQSEPPAR